MALLRTLCLVALLSAPALAAPSRPRHARRALPSDHPDYVGLVVLDEVDFPLPSPTLKKRWGKPSGTPTTTSSTATSTSTGVCKSYGLVTNGGLEDDASKGLFYAWSEATSGPGASGLQVTDTAASCYSGNYCFTVTNAEVPSADALTPWTTTWEQTFDVQEGQTYDVFFASKGPGDTNAKVEVDVVFKSKAGATLSTPAVPIVSPPSSWAPTTFEVQAPSECPDNSGMTATVTVKVTGETCVQNQVISVDCVSFTPK